MKPLSNRRLIVALCGCEVLTMMGVFAFPALLPSFVAEWALTKAEAGWIAGVYFAGYALAAPFLLAITDRLDARRVLFAGCLIAFLTNAGFALFASGFASAMVFRFLAGVGLAATYMPGLRVLVDRYRGPHPSRAISYYTASFSLGTAFSFLAAGQMDRAFGWQAAFAVAAAGAVIAAVVVSTLPKGGPRTQGAERGLLRLLDFGAVWRNRKAAGYILAYGIHCWELFTLRSWMVAMLAFTVSLDDGSVWWLPLPTTVATVAGLVAMVASIGGNELCVRFGRIEVITRTMIVSTLAAALIGFAADWPYAIVAALMLLYTALVQLDSAALTAGAVAAAEPGREGTTLGLHAFIGFGGGAIGPIVLGFVLDLSGGGGSALSWGAAFASVAVIGCFGPIVLRLARR